LKLENETGDERHSRKFPSTGGWGLAQVADDKSDDESLHTICFSCHEPAKDRDFVFTRYAP
jgi:Cytochrome P460